MYVCMYVCVFIWMYMGMGMCMCYVLYVCICVMCYVSCVCGQKLPALILVYKVSETEIEILLCGRNSSMPKVEVLY